MPYKLSATLKAHTSDVRAVSSPSDILVLSASRDTTAISWKRSSVSPSPAFTPEAILKAGSRFVNAVAFVPPSPDASEGYAVTGGQDAVINLFNLRNPGDEPDFCLIGHADNICTLHVTPAGTIVSGSWDKTAKVWRNHSLVHDLKGHQQSVWAVLAIDENQYLTGSADNTIKLWQEHKHLHTFRGHQQAVRGLAIVPDIGFASCSNDSEIRVWALGGDVIYTLSGHTSFVYSLSVLPSGDIASAGEDRTVRIWKDGECSQTIVHPAISVWTVSTMPNGDIVSGSSDGIVRIFSEAEERWASAEELTAYEESVASQSLPSQQLGDLNKEQLQDVDGLAVPGKKDGEVKMIRNGSKVEAYTWDSMARIWQKMGEVVDAVGSNRKQLYQGKEYDYVFDVDIQDGVPPLKLPYNASENPYGAAQRFLQSNDLPLSYVDQVVQFIEKNTAGVKLGGEAEDFVDPFTGASRYRATQPTSAAGQYMDPFTGASRYLGSGSQSSPSPAAAVSEPTSVPSTPTATAPRILPVTKAVSFNQANVTLMRTKFLQLNEAFSNEISTLSIALYPQEVTLLDEVFTYLTEATSGSLPSTSLTAAHIEAIMSILERWPSSQRFPLIDVSRLVLAFCLEAPFDTPGLKVSFMEALFVAAGWSDGAQEAASVGGKVKETNTTLMLKALANATGEGEGGNEEAVMAWVGKVLAFIGRVPFRSLVKAQKVIFATILFNVSCEGINTRLETTIRDAAVEMVIKILNEEATEIEAVYRTLVGLGNFVHAAAAQKNSFQAVHLGQMQQRLPALSKQTTDSRVSSVCMEIASLL